MEQLDITSNLTGNDIISEAIMEVEHVVKDPGIIMQYLAEVPGKALQLGIRIVLTLVIFLIGVQIIKVVRKVVHRSMVKANADKGAIQFMDSFIKAALYVLLIFMLASHFGVDAASIVAVIGSAGVAIGLAVQGSLSNLAGGVLLLVQKPFIVGDYIVSESGHEGSVVEIRMFYTRLATPDNKAIIIPNGNLANKSLVNVTASKTRRLDIEVGVSYNSDIKLAKEVLLKILIEDSAVLQEEEVKVFVKELADSCVLMGLRCWLYNEDYWEGKWRITEQVKYALDEAKIHIPLPGLEVYVQKDVKEDSLKNTN